MDKEQIKLQRREVFTPSAVSLREEGDKAGIIEGVAVVTNKETILWEDSDYREIEVIDPAALNKEFLAKQDIKLNLLHERKDSFARTPNLRVFAREDGLHFETDVPDCDLGHRAEALIGNGTYTGCSFEFWPKDYKIVKRQGADGKAEYVVRHLEFETIGALTIAMDPAYKQTSINARELYRELHPDENGNAEKPAAEQSAREAAEQAAREAVEKAEEEAAEKAAEEAAEKAREQKLRDEKIASVQRQMELLSYLQ